MLCSKPLKAVQCGVKANGKMNNIFIGKYCKDNRIQTPQTQEEFESFAIRYRKKIVDLPCGQCMKCRLEYSRGWALRCVKEAEQFEHNAFITLTYEPEQRPLNNTLRKADLKKFMKDLRRHYEYNYKHQNIRFFACGEYTPINGYPHFHIAAFNIEIPDKQFFKITETKEPLYISDSIAKIWGRGFITIGDVNWNSAAYVARYVTKKMKGPDAKKYYEAMGKIPEYTNMSRRPGIGQNAFEMIKDDYGNAKMLIKTNKGVKELRPCRYYDKLYEKINPDEMKRLREAKRKKAEMAEMLRATKTTTDEFEYRKIQEENLKERIKILDRNKIT